jgi:hypothetical protein
MFGKKALVFAIIGAIIFSALPSMASAEETGNENSLSIGDVIIETGSTELFGGGDYISLNLSNAHFGVIYGNETNPNSIIIFSEYTRYLGVATVNYENGTVENKSIPIRTIFGQRLEFMVEVNRTRQGQGVDLDNINIPGVGSDKPRPVKALSLNKTWKMSWINNGTVINDTVKVWNFSLSIENQMYDRVWNGVNHRNGTADDGFVEKVEYTFHVTAEIKNKTVSIPRYNITVQNEKNTSTFVGNETYNVTFVSFKFKYDHDIVGWDFESNESKLVSETHLLLGSYIPLPVAKWLKENFLNKTGGNGKAKCDDENYNETNHPKGPKLLKGNIMGFDDNWQRIGLFRWVSNVTVYNETGNGTEKSVFFQVHGGRRREWHQDNAVFIGFSLKGAFIYPSGCRIYHDPEYEVNALFFKGAEEGGAISAVKQIINLLPNRAVLIHVAEVLIIAIIVAGIAVAVKKKRK